MFKGPLENKTTFFEQNSNSALTHSGSDILFFCKGFSLETCPPMPRKHDPKGKQERRWLYNGRLDNLDANTGRTTNSIKAGEMRPSVAICFIGFGSNRLLEFVLSLQHPLKN